MLAALLVLAALQDASVAQPAQDADGTQRWSILVDPCASAGGGQNTIVVCGKSAQDPRIPLRDERGPPDRAMPSNPELTGAGALALTQSPCATRSEGCTTGVNLFGGATFVARLAGKLINPDSCCDEPGEATNPIALAKDVGSAVGKVFRKKPDKSNRVPILLDDPVAGDANPRPLP